MKILRGAGRQDVETNKLNYNDFVIPDKYLLFHLRSRVAKDKADVTLKRL